MKSVQPARIVALFLACAAGACSPPEATPPAQLPGGLMSLMSMSNELVSVSGSSIDAQSFEPPTGYKKIAGD